MRTDSELGAHRFEGIGPRVNGFESLRRVHQKILLNMQGVYFLLKVHFSVWGHPSFGVFCGPPP